MAAPIFTVTDTTSSTINSISYSNVNAGATSANSPLLFWNNQGGSSVLSDATNVTITTKTFNGLDTGDTIVNGQEVVTDQMLYVQCTSQGDTTYTPVGGPTTAPIGNSTPGTIQGSVGGTYAFVNTFIAAPTTVTAGPASFIIRVNYLYT